jgi:hypothetical protein
MVRSNNLYLDFSGGEVSPEVYGRADLALYNKSLKRMSNFIADRRGEARFRNGFRIFAIPFDNEVREPRLLPYKGGNNDNYLLEVTPDDGSTNGHIRVYKNETAPDNTIQAEPTTVPYLTAELSQVQWAQNENQEFFAHRNHKPLQLTQTNPTTWPLANYVPTADVFTTATTNPGTVAFYESRIVWGGTITNANRLFWSKSGDIQNLTIGTADDDGFQYDIAGINEMLWLNGTQTHLAVGSFTKTSRVVGGQGDEIITPTTITAKPDDFIGASRVTPAENAGGILYAQSTGLTTRSYAFDPIQQGFTSTDLNDIAPHITESGIKEMTFQNGKPNILWVVLNNGSLTGITYSPRDRVFAWHRQPTNGEIVSAAAVPLENGFDRLYVAAKRNIGGTEKYFVEFLEEPAEFNDEYDFFTDNEAADTAAFEFDTFESQKQYFHVDSGVTYDGSDRGRDAGASLTPAAVAGTSITFTASANVFASGDVGSELWARGVNGRATITAFNSATDVTCDIIQDFTTTDAMISGDWYIATDTVSGLTHLEGETVTICADGGGHPTAVVSSGDVTLQANTSVAHAGLKIPTGFIQTLDIEAGGTNGPAQTKKKNTFEVAIRFRNTIGAKYGTGLYKLTQIIDRKGTHFFDRPPLPSNESQKFNINTGWARDRSIIIAQDNPFPCVVQLISVFTNTSNT